MGLRIGLVGTGQIAIESHLPVLKSLRNIEVVAVCDQRVSLAKDVASRFGVKDVFNDVKDMLDQGKLDVVDICTPPHTHASLSILAMEAGCHVLVEKPMAISVREADTMLEASRKNGVVLSVIHQNLYNPVVVQAKRMVNSGVLGELLNVEVQTLERKDSELCQNENHWCHKLPGGIFFEILPHPVYLLKLFLTDLRPVHVLGKKLGNASWMPIDELSVLVDSSDAVGTIVASCNSMIHGDTLAILGTKMALKADLWGRTMILQKPRGLSAFSVGTGNLNLSLQLLKVLGSTASIMMRTLKGRVTVSAHYAIISEFVNSIINNSPPPTTGEQGRETVRILEDISMQLKQ